MRPAQIGPDCGMRRHHIKPGITGLAQVTGYRGETDTLGKMTRRVGVRSEIPQPLVRLARPLDPQYEHCSGIGTRISKGLGGERHESCLSVRILVVFYITSDGTYKHDKATGEL